MDVIDISFDMYSIYKAYMKKIITLIVILLAITGCAQKNLQTQPKPNDTALNADQFYQDYMKSSAVAEIPAIPEWLNLEYIAKVRENAYPTWQKLGNINQDEYNKMTDYCNTLAVFFRDNVIQSFGAGEYSIKAPSLQFLKILYAEKTGACKIAFYYEKLNSDPKKNNYYIEFVTPEAGANAMDIFPRKDLSLDEYKVAANKYVNETLSNFQPALLK